MKPRSERRGWGPPEPCVMAVVSVSSVTMEELLMSRRNWLWVALLGLPVAVAGGLAYANTSQALTFTCPLTGEELPCSKCCPLNGAAEQKKVKGFTCPVTGEELPCEKCCPLNGAKAEVKTEEPKLADGEYVCPLTGENLGCPRCCPLNKAKK